MIYTHQHRVTCQAGRIRRSLVVALNPPYQHAQIEALAEQKFRAHFGWEARVDLDIRSRITSTTIKPEKGQ